MNFNLTLIIILVPLIVFILLILPVVINFTPLQIFKPTQEKKVTYECGFNALSGQNKNPVSVRFYLLGILFLIFDLELVMLFPSLRTLSLLGTSIYWSIYMFIFILSVGFIFEIATNALDWNKR